jgi:organic radical activating enzyme
MEKKKKIGSWQELPPVSYPYKTREGGATVTVFVPYDCKNNCPFCVNKEEYACMDGFSADKICDSIEKMSNITPNCDFVFTGGEPFANLETLQKMLDKVPSTHRVFINTTLPVSQFQTEEDIIAFTEKNKNKITCINVSRHMQHYVQESNDELLTKLAVPFRINCVLYKNYPKAGLIPYLERFRKIHGATIQFRFDYTATTPENLYEEENDQILQDLNKIARFTGLDGCRMRCGFHFDYKGMELTYHKTLPYSTVMEKDPQTGITYAILYDILIKQTGSIHGDWDSHLLNVEAYKKAVFEPYDLKWLKRATEEEKVEEASFSKEACAAF